MQCRLIAELKEGRRSPVDIHEGGPRIEGGYLAEFIARAVTQMRSVTEAITEAQFAWICALLSDPKRNVYAIGGEPAIWWRSTCPFICAKRVPASRIAADPETWPEYLLRIRPGDVFFIVDFRRYQPAT